MKLTAAKKLAHDLMAQHGLVEKGWTFRFDNARRRFGRCEYGPKTISLSRALTRLNDEPQVRDTILHEIAHALTRGSSHGHVWRETALAIGCNGRRCYDAGTIVMPKGKYVETCPGCAKTWPRFRRRRRPVACSSCCKRHNGGRFDQRFVLTMKPI